MLTAICWLKNNKPFIQLLALAVVPLLLPLLPTGVLDSGITVCVFKNITGLSCPGCGITHALFSIAHGRFTEALYYNQLIIIIAPLLLFIWLKNLSAVLLQNMLK
jgi:hypothetical protein